MEILNDKIVKYKLINYNSIMFVKNENLLNIYRSNLMIKQFKIFRKKILITGFNGFKGAWLCLMLKYLVQICRFLLDPTIK